MKIIIGLSQSNLFLESVRNPIDIKTNNLNSEYTTSLTNSVRKLIESITPLNKMGSSDDIANIVEFLCSNKGKYITGQEFFVDGGINLRGQESIARQTTSLK
mgnify:CR=1 FL=1